MSGVMLRYPLALLIAYALFLAMAGLWAWYVVRARGEARTDGNSAGDSAGDWVEDAAEEVADGLVDAGVRGVSRRAAFGGSGRSWDFSFDSDEEIGRAHV